MSGRARTIQQIDPLGALGARVYSVLAGVAVVLLALFATWSNPAEVRYPWVAALAILTLAAASLLVIVATDARRTAVGRVPFVAAISLAFGASVLASIATWGTGSSVEHEWGPVGIGILILTFVPYRTAHELAVAGILSSVFVGFVALLRYPPTESGIPTMLYVLAAATPVLALSFAASALVSVVITAVVRWQERALDDVRALASQLHDGIARSVQENRVTILNRDVVPFFEEVLNRADISQDDREHASQISDSIRSVMVAEVDRSWLDGVVEEVGSAILGSDAPGSESVLDPERIAAAMTTDQRTAIRALLVALFGNHEFEPDGFDVVLGREDDRCAVTIRASFRARDGVPDTGLAPYLAVLRVVFLDLRSEIADRILKLRFFYDER